MQNAAAELLPVPKPEVELSVFGGRAGRRRWGGARHRGYRRLTKRLPADVKATPAAATASTLRRSMIPPGRRPAPEAATIRCQWPRGKGQIDQSCWYHCRQPRRGPREEGIVPGRSAGGLPILLQLSPGAREPLYRQLYRELRSAVLAGRLTPGARLPSTGSLAVDLGVSRNTVLQAFDQLTAEGFLEGRVGFGTRVARTLPGLAPPRPAASDQRRSPASAPRLARRGKAILAVPLRASLVDGRARAFRPGTPALEEFPTALWGRLLSRRWSRSGFAALDYGDAAGYRPLREAIPLRGSLARRALRRRTGTRRVGLATGARPDRPRAARPRRRGLAGGSRLLRSARGPARRGGPPRPGPRPRTSSRWESR